MLTTSNCPACHGRMTGQTFATTFGGTVQIDLCFACRGLWFDPLENLKLSPAAVLALFRQLHAHRDDAAQALPGKLTCPRCNGGLVQGFDLVKSGRYITHRCPQRHGRFSTFASFMIEKGFVRQLTAVEIESMAQRLGVISCSNCGAPVDLRQSHVCPHCRTALSLLDPQAVERALQGLSQTATQPVGMNAPDLADALMAIERDRARAEREARSQGGFVLPGDTSARIDLWAAGLGLVWALLK
ncbi:MAG: zf-TFIIB domain-containing protein [Rhodoferax sp.]|nr:zf-TFIIB domain-containing protein [Rhodoferax sp.]